MKNKKMIVVLAGITAFTLVMVGIAISSKANSLKQEEVAKQEEKSEEENNISNKDDKSDYIEEEESVEIEEEIDEEYEEYEEYEGETILNSLAKENSGVSAQKAQRGFYFFGDYYGNTDVGEEFKTVYTIKNRMLDGTFIEKYIYKNKDFSFNYLDNFDMAIVWDSPIILGVGDTPDNSSGGDFKTYMGGAMHLNNEWDDTHKYEIQIRFNKYKNGRTIDDFKNELKRINPKKDEYYKTFEDGENTRVIYSEKQVDGRGDLSWVRYYILMNYGNIGDVLVTYYEYGSSYDEERALEIVESFKFVKPKYTK